MNITEIKSEIAGDSYYKVEHPKEYEEIMRLLFQKDYGIGLSHIKL